MPRPELSQLRYPNLWQGCVGAWCPSQSGATGYRLFDDSGNNNHGTLTGMDPGTDWVPSGGKLALDFDGINDYVATNLSCSNRSNLDISAWIYRASTSNNAYVGAGEGGGSGPRANIYIAGSTTYVTAETSGSNGYGSVSNTRIGWNHFHYSYVYIGSNSDNLKLWINGVEQSLTYFGFVPGTLGNVGFFEIGRTKGEALYATAQVDDVRAWSRRLTPSEIRLLYTGGRGAAYERSRGRKKAYVPGYRITAPSRIQTGSARTIDGTDTESLSRGLVGAWCPSLGASGYRLIDRSGNGNHGTLTNMDPGTDWVPSGGKLALDFDGVNDCIEIPNREYLQSLQVPMTISAWCYKSSGSNGAVFSQYQNVTGSLLVKIAAYGTTEFAYYASTAAGGFQRVAYSTVPSLNQWHFLTWVVSGSIANPTCRLGQNGVEESFSLSALSSSPVTSVPHRIGCTFYLGANAEFNKTTLDDIRIYNRALTPSEIRLLYTGGRGVGLLPESKPKRARIVAWDNQDKISVPARVLTNTDSLQRGLVGHWSPSLSGPQGNRLMDLSGQNNHGTLTNMDYQTDYVPSTDKGGRMALDFGSPFTKFINAGTPSLFPNVGFATISAWFLSRNNASQSIVAKSLFGAATGRWWMYTGAGLVGVDGPSGSGLASAQFSTTHANTGWHHILATFAGTTMSLYYDGMFRSSATIDLIQNSTYSLLFARYNDSSGSATQNNSNFNGQIDDVRIYNRVLTPNEIRLLAQSRMPERATPQRTRTVFYSSGLVSYLRRRTYNSILGSGVLS